MKIGALALCSLAAVAQAQYSHPMPQNPVTLAAYDATRKCAAVAPDTSLNYCGTSMLGNTPAHTAARRAFNLLIRQRSVFMDTCEESFGIVNCSAIASAMVDEGSERALVDK